jgi:sugar phosphate isomerase/epimerase
MADTFVLENRTLRLVFDRANGALVGVTAASGWPILDRPQLGLSWRLLVPLSDERRNNPVLGEKQPLTALLMDPGGCGVTMMWDGVESEVGGHLDIRLTLRVTLGDRQAVWTMTVENGSPLVIENVYCPYLGDVQHPDAEWFKTFVYQYNTATEWSMWPTYQNTRGYYGVDYPTQVAPWVAGAGAPMSPYILLRGAHQGLYVGVAAPSSELVAWHGELRPGYGSSIDARVPETANISGLDVATRFAAVHVPYIQPGETRELTPIALEAYQGGWQQGVDIYRAWRSTWMRPAEPPAWAREPHSWQQLHINSPEDELRISFRDLPAKVAAVCARHGVKAIQLVGWNDGGQDQGNPSHNPDPRLGTVEELKEAIRQIQAMGVKLVLFAKFTWADRATDWFRRDLIRLAIKDPYGDYYLHPGYQYQTATQLLDINTKRLIPMCFGSEEYLRVCEAEFQKMLDYGADGILFDECLHHGPALLCFDPSHGHRAGWPVYAHDRLLIQRFAKLAEAAGKGDTFLFAGEACYDWEMEAYQLSYHRTESKHHLPLSRYMLPHGQFMTAVTGWNDRNMINQCLMYRYIISYEPYNFKGSLDDYPLTMAYGRQMDDLRTELRAYFWDGEFRDMVGATVTAGDKAHHPYAVFAHAETQQEAVVVCNYDEHEPVTVNVTLDSGQALSRYRLADDPLWRPTTGGVTIPPQSAAVVLA